MYTVLALALQELGKERPSDKTLDRYTERYVECLNKIESDTLAQINYLTQVGEYVILNAMKSKMYDLFTGCN